MSKLGRILREFKRRNVIRAGVAYVVTGWFVVQIANVILPTLNAPDWIMQALLTGLVLFSPVPLIIAWFFEFTSSGFKRTEDVLPGESSSHAVNRQVDFVIIGILAGGLSLSLYANFRGPEGAPEPISVLIADFENGTGNDLLSGVVEEVLRIGLEVAPFVEIFDRRTAASIAASLSASDAEPGSLDLETASVVALRQGVNIVVGGSVRRANDQVSVSVTGVAPADQRELFSNTRTVATDADVIVAVDAIARALRVELGDTEKPGGAGEFESFAVANLEAAAEYVRAQDLQLSRRLEEAVSHYERALEYDPDFARAYAGLALTQAYLGRIEAATENWSQTLARLDQLTERGRLRTLGNYYFRIQQDYERALETYETLAERYPADNVALNNLAVAAFQTLDFERALEVGRELYERFPNHSGFGANLALYEMYAGRFEEAAEVAREVIEIDPRSAYSFLVLALTSAVAGDLAAAESTYERMTGLDLFSRSTAAEGLADLAFYRGDFDAAIATLEMAIDAELAQGANQTAAFKQVMRAEALLRMGGREEARSAVDAALRDAGDEPAVLVPAALALLELGDVDRAQTIADDMSESFSKSRRAYANLIRAAVARTRGDPMTAIEHADAAIELADLWLVRYIRGSIYAELGRFAEAGADLQACLSRLGEGIAVFLNDRPSLRRLRDVEAAIAQLPQPAPTE